MSNGINRKDLHTDEFWEGVHQEVHDAVKIGKSISTRGKRKELLKYQQKVAEYKRLYYQWLYTWIIFFLSISFGIILNKLIDYLIDRYGKPSLLLILLALFAILLAAIILYKWLIKPRFDACQAISLDIEREILTIEMEKK